MDTLIAQSVHDLYWNRDLNCARTCLLTLGKIFGITIEPQTFQAAVGLHGAGGYRAQCGLVEGALMFIGIYFHHLGKSETEIIDLCYNFADAFTNEFSSLRCYDLRPGGFTPEDEPHLCEDLTVRGIEFVKEFIMANR